MDVDGSMISLSSQSLLACRRVAWRTALRRRCSRPWALLMSAAAILHLLFHHESPLLPCALHLAKNLSQVVCVSVIRLALAWVREGMSVIKGCGN